MDLAIMNVFETNIVSTLSNAEELPGVKTLFRFDMASAAPLGAGFLLSVLS
jgi:hypothetical protein